VMFDRSKLDRSHFGLGSIDICGFDRERFWDSIAITWLDWLVRFDRVMGSIAFWIRIDRVGVIRSIFVVSIAIGVGILSL
jgi:hypothetical protein